MSNRRKILTIVLVAAAFVFIDCSIYVIFTARLQDHRTEVMQAKSVELADYLPQDEGSAVVKERSGTVLKGDLPVLDGAAALYPVYSAFVYAVYPEDSWEFDGSDFTDESCLQMKNTREAYRRIVDGDADLAFLAAPSEEQLQYAKDNGVQLVFQPIGKEAFVFLVNSRNPVNNLTEEQLRGIYSGRYRNWKELGGDSSRINALTRNEGSGSQTALLSFLDGEDIHKDPLGFAGSPIGFSFRYYVEGITAKSGVKMLSVNGVYPDRDNIASGNYPISSEFYAVYRKDNKNRNVKILLEWILSEEGQRVIEESGYVRYR